MSIPIFDSLIHPTIDGNWILPKYPNVARIEVLKEQMHNANVQWAFAVGMMDIGSYSEHTYVSFVQKHFENTVYPIAYYHPHREYYAEVVNKLRRIKNLGYFGIKLHPRFSDFYFDETMVEIINAARDLQLIVMICTYNYSGNNACKITPESLMDLLTKVGNAKIILLHAGAVRLMEYVEIAKAFPYVLLDLSFTMCKYRGSSLDLDLKYVFENLDKRICVGSDFPEISLNEMRQRFDFFSNEINVDKAENIAFKNIQRLINK